jgi:hypothetical protein
MASIPHPLIWFYASDCFYGINCKIVAVFLGIVGQVDYCGRRGGNPGQEGSKSNAESVFLFIDSITGKMYLLEQAW